MNYFSIIDPIIHPKLSKLSKEDIKNLLIDYQNSELKIKEIVAKYQLDDVNPSQLKNLLPPFIFSENICPCCNVVSWSSISSRDSILIPYCPVCKEKMYENFWPERRIQQIINERYSARMNNEPYEKWSNTPSLIKIDISDEKYASLNYPTKVYLGMMVSLALSPDMVIVDSLKLGDYNIFQNKDFKNSCIESISEKESPFGDIVYQIKPDISNALLFPENGLNGTWDEKYQLWKYIAKEEAKDYLNFRMAQNRFTLTQGEIVDDIFNSLLDSYSLSNIFNFIYMAVTNGCRHYTQHNVRKHAANTIIHSCLSLGNRYKANGWPAKQYHRTIETPQLEFSSYYFNAVLKIGDKGFFERPSVETLMVAGS